MKVKLLTSRAGAGFSQNRGDVIDVPNAEAIRMIEAGQAEPERADPVEREVPKAKAEKAVK